MIDPIGNSGNSPQRTQSPVYVNRLRDTSVLTAVQQTQQRSSSAVSPVKVFAVPQTSKSSDAPTAKLPRGSIVDIYA